jgi:hypothetical protein
VISRLWAANPPPWRRGPVAYRAGRAPFARLVPGLALWAAVAISATVGGILLGVSAEKALYESCRFDSWLVQALLIAGIVAPLPCSIAQISERAPLTLLELIGWRRVRVRSLPAIILGGTLAATTMIAAETALGLIFDPRWRDFPFASLTMAVVPFWTLTLLSGRRESDPQPLAEALFACLLAAAAPYILFEEGSENWQALWTSAAYLLLGATLLGAKFPGPTRQSLPKWVTGATSAFPPEAVAWRASQIGSFVANNGHQ